MNDLIAKRIKDVRGLDQKQAQLIFRKLYQANEDILMIQDYLMMADNGYGEINTASLPSLIRLLDRAMWAMTESNILLCPSIDPLEAQNQKRLAQHPEFDNHAA